MVIQLKDISVQKCQQYLLSAIAPRLIGLVSTMDKDGNANLAPFSYFNFFSANPPIVIFSPLRRVRDNSTKHTLENLYEIFEVVIHIVTYDMVQQASLASCEYPKGVDEFIKAGFTKEPATMVRPPMVKESPIKLECFVKEIKPMGHEGGAGNLIICEIACMHIDESILDEHKDIDQLKINHVARLGGDWYCRVDRDNLFKVPKPNTKLGIGIDSLPEHIRNSKILTGNDLAILANVHEMPEIKGTTNNHEDAKRLLEEGRVDDAWEVLMN